MLDHQGELLVKAVSLYLGTLIHIGLGYFAIRYFTRDVPKPPTPPRQVYVQGHYRSAPRPSHAVPPPVFEAEEGLE